MTQKAKGSATAPTVPSHGSTNPEKEKEMNKIEHSIGPASMPALSRRLFIGGAAIASLPITPTKASEPETHEQKCVRLIHELLAECRQLQPNFESRGGPVFKFGATDPAMASSQFGFGKPEDTGELLMVFLPHKGGAV